MGSPLGPLLANVFMCSIEETLEREGKMPTYYRRFVDDTLTIMPDKASADNFLEILNQCHSSIKFTMETESNNMLPFLWAPSCSTNIQILNQCHSSIKFTMETESNNMLPFLWAPSCSTNIHKLRLRCTLNRQILVPCYINCRIVKRHRAASVYGAI